MKRSVLVLSLILSSLFSFAQFVPNRGFELGTSENDVEDWTISGDCGVIRRVKFHLFQTDTIFPIKGEYMLLFENPDGCKYPNKAISIRFYTGNFLINRISHIQNSYFVDSMGDLLRGSFQKYLYNGSYLDTIQNITFSILPGNIWFNPTYMKWYNASSGAFEPLYADSAGFVFQFDSVRGFTKGSFALIDDLRIYGISFSGTNSLEMPESGVIGIFPNPFIDKVNIASFYRGTCRITDNMGRQVFETEFRQSPLDLDLGHLAQGMYFLELITGSGKKFNVKMLKQ